MSIDKATGHLELDGLRIAPGLTHAQFLASRWSGQGKSRKGGPGYAWEVITRCPIDGETFFVELCFFEGVLDYYSLTEADAEDETQRQRLHDQWLARLFGPPHERDPSHQRLDYQFDWGAIGSSYDPRGDASSITVRFASK